MSNIVKFRKNMQKAFYVVLPWLFFQFSAFLIYTVKRSALLNKFDVKKVISELSFQKKKWIWTVTLIGTLKTVILFLEFVKTSLLG